MGVLSKFLGGGGIVSAAEGIANIVDKFVETPEERQAAEIIKQKMLMRPAEMQVELNKIEAGHRSIFVAGWRPWIGWVCGTSLALFYIPQFALGAYLWVRQVLMSGELVPYPISADGLLELVGVMLGFGALRTYEKLKGKSK